MTRKARSSRRRALVVLIAATPLLASCGAKASGLSWSSAGALPGCGPPKVVFPFSSPSVRSGAGAIVWVGCGALEVAPLDGADQPGGARPLESVPLAAPLAVAGTTRGQIVAVAGAAGQALLGEAFATHGAARLRALGGSDSLVATQTGFIGDVDVATVVAHGGGYAIKLRAQRHFQHRFGRALLLPVGAAMPTALALGMDYRADRLVIWDANGELYARYVSNDGRVARRQRLGPAGYAPQVSAVLSDDYHAFVIWTVEPPPGVAGTARVLLAHSTFGPHFHGARTLASFGEPAGLRLSPGAVAAERLSSEGVALLWPALSGADLVVEAAGATQSGLRTPSSLAVSGQDVRLGAVATGPDNEIVVLLDVAPRGAARQAIFAVRSNVVRQPGGLGFGALTQLAPPGPNSDPSVAVDPDSDAAVAAWRTPNAIDWSVGTGS
jgi:hypothetical protein